ncbi:MAG: hypothetical protein IIB36_20020 [Gemmatimonadetes bacterium]|nr:hypothetical protein [Gemmatimonadota bacterium]
MSSQTPISDVRNVIDLGLKKWPGVNYGKHPAYGGAFKRPGVGRRMAALKAFAPYFTSQVKVALRPKTGWSRPKLDESQGPVYNTLITDGIVGFQIPESDKRELKLLVATPIAKLKANKKTVDTFDFDWPAPAYEVTALSPPPDPVAGKIV